MYMCNLAPVFGIHLHADDSVFLIRGTRESFPLGLLTTAANAIHPPSPRAAILNKTNSHHIQNW